MKKFSALVILICSITFAAIGQVSISADSSAPDPSAMLDVKSQTKGLLAPRVALTATNVSDPVSSPAIGLQVYNTATAGIAPYDVKPGLYSWDGTQWIAGDAPKGASVGDMQYWNGSQWVIVPAGVYGQQLYFCDGIPTWGGCPPVLSTSAVTDITYNSAISGGNITLDGGLPVTVRGVCWSTSPNPTISDSKTSDGSGIGTFESNISGLLPNTLYFVRSYATNGAGTGYGNEFSFTTLCETYNPVGLTIQASSDLICMGSSVSFTATAVNGGNSPSYQWQVNGNNVGSNMPTFMYMPENNDIVTCTLTSDDVCTVGSPFTSFPIMITVVPLLHVSIWIEPMVNPVCDGTSVTLMATNISGGSNPAFQWKVNGTDIPGATNYTFTYAPQDHDSVLCQLTAFAPCTLNNPALSNTVIMSVTALPSIPTTGVHIPTTSQIKWTWDSVSGATGYKWNVANDYSSAIDMGTATTKTETGLTCDSAYTRYVWAYNSCGNSSPLTLTQITSACGGLPCAGTPTVSYGGQTYNTVQIGSQCWLKENLNLGTRINGVQEQTNNNTIEKYCPNDDEAKCAVYGGLYQWDEAMNYTTSSISNPSGRQGICPSGWHIPSDAEWCLMESCLDSTVQCSCSATWCGTDAGGKMKEAGTIHWDSPNTGATNSSGFSAVGSSLRAPNGGFYNFKTGTNFWSSTETSSTYAKECHLNWVHEQVMRSYDYKSNGFSVRCIKDSCDIPPSPTSGTNSSTPSQIIWNWNTVTGAAGYKWNITNDYATALEMGSITTKTETGLVCNTSYTRYVWAYKGCGISVPVNLSSTTTACSPFTTCGQYFTVNHVEGAVAPVTKTVNYGTVTNIPGELSKCWITSNLGSNHQAIAINDSTEASAGWYWQFNRKQGYKHTGITVTPAWTITSINQNSNWVTANDPCNLELESPWRLPTYTEWNNVFNAGGWGILNGPWDSNLKLHAAGHLNSNNGAIDNRGIRGYYWSSTQTSGYRGWGCEVGIGGGSYMYNNDTKADAFTLRCLREN